MLSFLSSLRQSRLTRRLPFSTLAKIAPAPPAAKAVSFEELPGTFDPNEDFLSKVLRCPFEPVKSVVDEHPSADLYKVNALGKQSVLCLNPSLAHKVYGWEARNKGLTPSFPAVGELFGQSIIKTFFAESHSDHMNWRKQFRMPFSQKTISHSMYIKMLHKQVQTCLDKLKNASESSETGQTRYVDVMPYTRKMTNSVGIEYMLGSSGLISDETSERLLNLMTLIVDAALDFHGSRDPGSKIWCGLKAKQELDSILRPVVDKARQMYENNELEQHTALYQLFHDSWLLDDSDIVNAVDTVQVILFLSTDTTSNALTTLLYHMASYPEHFEKLKEMLSEDEIGSKLIDPSYELKSYDEINNIECLHWFIQESMRMVPPVASSIRMATQDNDLQEGGEDNSNIYQVPDKTIVMIPNMYFQQSEKYWGPSWNTFDFSRFAKKEYDPKTMLQFGTGNRKCLGMHLAYLEMKLMILEYIRRACVLEIDESSVWFGTSLFLHRAHYNARLKF